MAILGASVTVFDISEENKRYAIEVAESANVKLDYQVLMQFCDFTYKKSNKDLIRFLALANNE